MLKVAIIGFGGIAKAAHLNPYLQLQNDGIVKLVAVCDVCPEQFTEKAEINIGESDSGLSEEVNKYTDYKEMLQKESVDMVDICLPTFLHAEATIYALNAGCHVLCEKPMSLSFDLCNAMVEAADKNGKKLMIGQCLRFFNIYNFLKDIVNNKTFGDVKGGIFFRSSAPPIWGWENWFLDYTKSQGCITDMHVHDIDMIRYLFGEPKSVSCHTQDIYSKKDAAHSTLIYPDFSILAIGDWAQEGTEFSFGYRISFEKAIVDCAGGKLTVYPRGAEAYCPEMPDDDCYFNEIKFFVESIVNGKENIANPPESAALTIKLVNKLIESSDKNGEIVLL